MGKSIVQFVYDNKSHNTNSKEGIRIALTQGNREMLAKLENTQNVFQLLVDAVKSHPSKPFLGSHINPTDPYSWINFKEVYETVLTAGSGLLRFPGIRARSGSCIGLYAANCPEWLMTELSCFAYGLVAVPLYDTLGVEALKHICTETELSVVFCDTPKRAERLIENLPDLVNLRHIVILSPNEELESLRAKAGKNLKICTFETLLSCGREHPVEPNPYDENGLIVICYTSGTTGIPKGAMIHNSTMLSVLSSIQAGLGNLLTCDDVMLSFLPLAHIYEQFNEILMLYNLSRIGYYSGNILNLTADMQALKPTIFTAVPRLLYRVYDATYAAVVGSKIKQNILKTALNNKCKYLDKQIYRKSVIADGLIFRKIQKKFGGCVRLVLLSSAPISPPVLRFTRAVFSCPVLEGYGSTETCGPVSISVCGDLEGGHVGAPLPNIQIKLVDVPEMGIVSSRDGKGEICVKARSCIKGYYKQPEKTAELIDKDGWLHTGDVGIWAKDSLKIVDRSKHIFKLSQGEYIAPEKLEAVYRESVLLQQVFVDGDALCSFPVAIVVPELMTLHQFLQNQKKGDQKRHGDNPTESVPSLEELCRNPKVKSLILADLKRLGENADLKGFEKVGNIFLLDKPFSVENGMLTPTLKAARTVIRKTYAAELAQLYEEKKEGLSGKH